MDIIDKNTNKNKSPYLLIVGRAQDGGFPHTGCINKCCSNQWEKLKKGNTNEEFVSCICLIIPSVNQAYFFDCTPDFKYQLNIVNNYLNNSTEKAKIEGIFITHAHYGHYLGLLQLGREVMGTKEINVYAYPRMRNLIENNAPFSQLVSLKNINLNTLEDSKAIQLNENINENNNLKVKIESFLVKHRGEFSETCGFRIIGLNKSVVFIPDIDSLEGLDIQKIIKDNDYLLLDGCFYNNNEVNFRDVKEIPHPFVESSINYLDTILQDHEKAKVSFIHLNHSNPLWNEEGEEYKNVIKKGYNVCHHLDTIFI
jgi:pyrroloquinoline quinone biosynthesis protein B